MPPKKKDEKREQNAGLIRGAPEIVPVLEMDHMVVFPSSTFPIQLTDDLELASCLAHLKEGAYLIVQPSARDGAEGGFPVGVLGAITNFDETDPQKPRFSFSGLYRVYVERMGNQSGVITAKHKPVQDIPLTEADAKHPGFQGVVSLLRSDFLIAFAIFTQRILGARSGQDFLQEKFVQDAMMRIRHVDAENIASVIDGIMNMLNHIVVLQPEKRIDIRDPSLFVLAESAILLRLKYLMAVLNALFMHDPSEETAGESDDEEADALRTRYEEIKDKISEEARKEIEKEFSRMRRAHSSEASKAQDHLELLLAMPWGTYTEDRQDLREAGRILNERHTGLDKIKDRILESIAVRQLNPSAKAPILCFVGPPGVGKTSLGQAIADALGRKFIRVSLGGMRDQAFLKGFEGTYISSKEGRIIEAIKRCGSSNPVFMIDEVDKIGEDYRGDPADALLEVLDPEQNNAFWDYYLNVHFDLSQIFFIATANILDPIHPALLDRMEVIELPGYTPLEKLRIAKDHLIPRRRKENGFPIAREGREPLDVAFTDEAILAAVHNYTREAGVRNLEREFDRPFRKIGKAFKSGDVPMENTIVISEENLSQFMGKPFIIEHAVRAILPAGVVPVLAVSDTGGHFFEAEVSRGHSPVDRKIYMRGVLGPSALKNSVNQIEESLKTVFAFLTHDGRILAERLLELEEKHPLFLDGSITNGGIPKDGPSAGVSLLLALYGKLTDQSIKPSADVPLLGATGAVTMNLGEIRPVGGIRDKILTAHRHGVRRLIIPKENENDLDDVPEEIRSEMEIKPLAFMLEALAYAYPHDERIRRFIESQQRSS